MYLQMPQHLMFEFLCRGSLPTLSMMTSSNGSIFRVTGPCAGNSPVTGEFPSQRPVTRSFDVSLICAWINRWVNNREVGDLSRHRTHHDVTAMIGCYCLKWWILANFLIWWLFHRIYFAKGFNTLISLVDIKSVSIVSTYPYTLYILFARIENLTHH